MDQGRSIDGVFRNSSHIAQGAPGAALQPGAQFRIYVATLLFCWTSQAGLKHTRQRSTPKELKATS